MQVLIARAVTRQLSLGFAGLALLALPAVASESISDALASGGTGPELVVIPAGQFQLGDGSGRGNDNERPPRTVTFAAPFAIGRYEVTFADWQRYAEAANLPMPDNEGWGLSARRPVIHVSWRDAHAYTQ